MRWFLLLLACTPSVEDTGTDGLVAPPTLSAPSTTDTGTGASTTPTTSTSSDTFDCAKAAPTLGPAVPVPAGRAYNDVAFVDGLLVGWDADALQGASSPTQAQVYAPGVDRVYKMVRLANGDLVASQEGGPLIRVATDGSVQVLAGSVFAYGLALGSDGMVYAATNFDAPDPVIWRIDPDTGAAEEWMQLPYLQWPRDIDFAPDHSALYIGTQWYGVVLKVPLDGTLDPAGPTETVATVTTQWHDTLETDACGALWVAGLFPPQLYRVAAPGQAELAYEWPDYDSYAHGWSWGTEQGGWDPLSIYAALPDVGGLVEQRTLGVPGPEWSGTLLNAAPL